MPRLFIAAGCLIAPLVSPICAVAQEIPDEDLFVSAETVLSENDGRVECTAYEARSDTCEILSLYRTGEDGGVMAAGLFVVNEDPFVTAEVVIDISLREGQLCAVADDIDLSLDGALEELEGQIEELIRAPFREYGEICSSYYRQPDSDGYVAIGRAANGEIVPDGRSEVVFFDEMKDLRAITGSDI